MAKRSKTADPLPRLGDLVEVPPIRTVIQLDHLGDPEARDEILESFVFTGEVREFFARLLRALGEASGVGCFLKGHYGSGKSHCLAFLDRLLGGDPAARTHLPEGLALPDRPFLPVPVPLLAFPSTARLEDVVMDALAEALHRATGRRVPLSDRARFLENFRTLVLPRHAGALPGFADLPDDEAERRARDFLDSLPENPLRLDFDRRRTFDAMKDLARGRGVVLLLDELSEFLKSKAGEAFHEDVRFLQFLGERAAHMPLWIVAGLQETLEEIGYREQAGYLRIKERYPLRFTLSARHVSDLIEGRLVRRRPGAEAAIDRVWEDLDEAFPGLVTREAFRATYPVHPSTLALLEGLMPLFSRHRGVVDFVHTRLAGDPLKGAEGLLDEPGDRLLTADSIFDHFQERIRETPELSPYDRVAFTFLQGDVPRLFEKERDRDVALRLVKILILAEISPVPVPRRPADLARMLARRVSRMDPELNVQYVREAVLGVLADRSSFVARDGDGFRVDLAANVNQVLERRVRERRRGARPSWVEAARLVNRASLPLQEMAGQPPAVQRIRWQHTQRAGLVGLVDLATMPYEDFAFLLTRLEIGEEDFVLLLALPGPEAEAAARGLLENARPSPMGRAVALWVPAPPDAELQDWLLEVAARRAVAAELHLEGQAEALRVLQSSLRDYEERVARGMAELYFAGRVLTLDGAETPPREILGWDRALLEAGGRRMEAVFPRHGEVAPESDSLTQRNLDLLWQGLLSSGRCPGEEGGLVPYALRLGLAERVGGEVVLRVDPARTPVLGEILDRLLPQEKTPLHDLARALHKGPFGATRAQFAVLVAALVQSGRAAACAGQRSTPLDSLRDLMTFRVDALAPGRLLDPVHQQRLQEVAWLWPGESLVPFTPARQRDLWQAASERLGRLGEAARAVRRVAEGRAGYRSTEALPLKRLAEEASRVEEMASRVGTPAGAEVGLRRLAEAGASDLAAPAARLEAWSAFLDRHLREFQEAWVRLRDLERDDRLADLAALATSDDPAERWEAVHRAFREADAEYRKAYAEAHEAFYGQEAFGLARETRARPEWQAAERLSGVLALEADPPFAEVARRVADLPSPCRRRVEDQLVLHPRCECGFRPGDEAPAPTGVEEALRGHLASACRDLVGRERLEEFVRGLREVGQEARARRVEEVLEAARDLASPRDLPAFWPRAAGRLATALDASTVDLLNRALTGRALVVRRDPAALLQALDGRRLPPARLRAAFEDWLRGEGLPEDAWVHVAGEEPSGEGAWLGAWLRQHGLEADARMRRQVDPSEAEPSGDPAAAEAALRPLLDEAAARLDPVEGALRERLFPGVSRDLSRRALRRAASDPEAARRLAGLPPDFPHAEVARSTASVLERCSRAGTAAEVLVAARDRARARHLDLEASLLTPDLEETVDQALAAAAERAREEAVPLGEVPARLLEGVPPTRPLLVLVVDALRWDLWDLVRPEVEGVLGPPDRLEVAAAPLPSVTTRGRGALLLAGDPEADTPAGYDGLFLGRPARLLRAADERDHRAEALDLLLRLGSGEGLQRAGPRPRGFPSESLMLHLSFVDRRAHESRLELWPLFQELLAEARLRLVPLLRAVPPSVPVLLTADHGFLAADEAKGLRRTHGGATRQERLVPAAAWLR